MAFKVPNGRTAVDAFYGKPGDPDSDWYKQNIVPVTLPFPLLYEGKEAKTARFHRLAAPFLVAALQAVYQHARLAVKNEKGFGHTTAEYDKWTIEWLDKRGLREYGGTYEYRKIRGAKSMSTHSYGIGIDVCMTGNSLGDTTPAIPSWYVDCFKSASFIWGGDFANRKDPMHFQLARGV